MGRPRQISDEQILASMRAHALEHGPGVSLDLVADELGVSTPALLKRFGTRRELLLAALRPPARPAWIDGLGAGPTEAPLEAQLLEIFAAATRSLAEVMPCILVLRESGIPIEEVFPREKPPEVALRALQKWLAAARRQRLVTAAETDTAAYAILGALQTRAMLAHITSSPFSPKAEAGYHAELARLFARALAP